MGKRVSSKSGNRQSARDLLRWLLLVPIAFLILFGCGQLALSSAAYPPAPDTRSQLRADYGPWPLVMIPAINPAIIDDLRRDEHLNPTVVARSFWPTSDQPAATSVPTLIAQQPTSTPTPPADTSTPISTPTSTPLPTHTATLYPTRTAWPTLTATPWPTPTDTPWPTDTARPPKPNTRTHTPTPITPAPTSATPTSTPTLTPSTTPIPTSSFTPTATDTPSATPTDTLTPTDTATPTSTPTSTLTPTPTATWALCTGNMPSGEPNIGLPNGTFAIIPCEIYLSIDLDAFSASHITSHPGYDFVYFENAGCGGICLDWVRVDVSNDGANWVTVFNWGDGNPDNNANIASYSGSNELDNAPIPAAALTCANGYCTGIEIDVDALGPVPSGGYRYIRLWSPLNPGNDGSEVDSLLIYP